jgi:hypothetical protein
MASRIEQPPMTPGGLQLDEDIIGQERAWRLERFGWAVMAVTVLAALVGLFGPGPLSHSNASSPDGTLQVQYERFVRMGDTLEMQVQVSGPLARRDELRLRVGAGILEAFQVQQLTPEPSESLPTGEDAILVYMLSGQDDQVTVTFNLQPQAIGPTASHIEVTGGPIVEFSQFLYP